MFSMFKSKPAGAEGKPLHVNPPAGQARQHRNRLRSIRLASKIAELQARIDAGTIDKEVGVARMEKLNAELVIRQAHSVIGG